VERPAHGPTLNALGLNLLDAGRTGEAIAALRAAAAADPKAPPVWLNLAEAHRRAGQGAEEIAALDGALAADPLSAPRLAAKGSGAGAAWELDAAAATYRNLLAASPDSAGLPPPIRAALAHAQRWWRKPPSGAGASLDQSLERIYAAHGAADLARVRGYAEQRAGRRKVFTQQPTGGHFPYLPAIEYFDRALFPWLDQLEAATDIIREELMGVWQEGAQGFRPYVGFEPGVPLNQWADLNHNPAWSAWFFWEDGERREEACARCPQNRGFAGRPAAAGPAGKRPYRHVLDPGAAHPHPAAHRLQQCAHHHPPAAGRAARLRLPGRGRNPGLGGGTGLGVRRHDRA
jgi:tetratricopeptide (TPR) repeat protein